MGPEFKSETTINNSPLGEDGSHGPFSIKDSSFQVFYVTYNKTDVQNYCWVDSD